MLVSDLKKRLSVEVLPVYFLKGQDTFMQDWAKNVLVSMTDADYSDFNVTVFENSADILGVVSTLNTVPVFADRRVVVVKSSEGIDDVGKSKLESYLENPAEFSILVFYDDSISKEDFAKKESPVFSLYKYGDVVDVSGANDMVYQECVTQNARSCGQHIEVQAIKLLSQYTSLNMTRTVNELKKLYAYADGNAVTAQMVIELVTPDTEYKSFALANALTKGDNDEGLKILKNLIDNGESPASLLSALTGQYRRMFEAKISSATENDIAKALGTKPFAISIAKDLANRYTPMELKNIVDKLHALEYEFKSGVKDESQSLYEAFALLLKKR